jgi:chromosome segregation ATPase
MRPYSLRKVIGLLPLPLALLGWTWQGENIRENVQLSKYQASPEIAKLVVDTKMSEAGRKIFYLNTPTIEEKKSGLNLCKKEGAKEKTVILGCYVSNRGIFIQKVNDKRLAGIMQVTAAHEMLHSAYHRLSTDDRKQVDQELTKFFEQLNNQRLKKLIAIYRKQDSKVVPNELHSILGTEVSNLGPFLENYYQRYFSDRSAVVNYAQKYESTFTNLLRQSEELDQQMTAMKPELNRLEASTKQQSSSIEQQRSELKRLQDSHKTSEYNSRVASFNRQVDSYNQQVNRLRQKVAAYNKLVKTYNSVSTEEKSLNESLNNGGN